MHIADEPTYRKQMPITKPPAELSRTKPQRVLIVDDDAACRTYLRSVLAIAGYDTAVASDGSAALASFKSDGPFDVVVTDVLMPRMSGSELGRYLRQLASSVKVLYVTGSRAALSSDKPQLSVYEAVVDKPCTPGQLIETLTMLVNVSS